MIIMMFKYVMLLLLLIGASLQEENYTELKNLNFLSDNDCKKRGQECQVYTTDFSGYSRTINYPCCDGLTCTDKPVDKDWWPDNVGYNRPIRAPICQ